MESHLPLFRVGLNDQEAVTRDGGFCNTSENFKDTSCALEIKEGREQI